MRALFQALALIFLGAGIISLLALLPLRDGYQFACLVVLERYCPLILVLLVAALVFLSLAAWCHQKANRRRCLR